MGSRDDRPERLNRLRGARFQVRKKRLQSAPGLLQCACRYGCGTYRYNPAREASFGRLGHTGLRRRGSGAGTDTGGIGHPPVIGHAGGKLQQPELMQRLRIGVQR